MTGDATETASTETLFNPEADALRRLGAVLFTAGGPLSEAELAEQCGARDLAPLLARARLLLAPLGLQLREAASGWDLVTAEDMSDLLADQRDETRVIGPAAREVLAVIAHNQPCTRSEVANVRGVEVSGQVMADLQRAGWIAPARGRGPHGATRWRTTDAFLEDFGYPDLGAFRADVSA